MADVQALAGEISKLFVGVGKDIYAKFKEADKDELAKYATQVAALAVKLQLEQDPTKRAQIADNLRTFENAAKLMVARYEIMAATALEKASISALELAVTTIIKIVTAL
jgi:hypothetical protein